jgi:hypothetical protein
LGLEGASMGLLDWFRQRRQADPKEPDPLPDGVSAHVPGGAEFVGQQTGVAADLLNAEPGVAVPAE